MMELDQALKAQESFATTLFKQLGEATHDGVGITRASYGEGEQIAHTLLAERARMLGLEVTIDAAGNTFMTLPGADRDARPMIIGSHLDSVAQGGNFDGAAGVVAGLVAVLALRNTGVVPVRNICVMGIRAEEGEWFGESFIGSRSALGTLPQGALDRARRVDSGLALHEHMVQAGCDLHALRAGHVSLPPNRLHGFIEVHIEQGPILDEACIPVGLVTGIRGNARLPEARCTGEYSHCGGVPRKRRRDAVVAVAELVSSLDDIWTECEAAGQDFAFTVGKLFTDAKFHAMSKIAGAVNFTLDMRSVDNEFLDEMEARIAILAADIAVRRGVNFELGDFTRAECGVLAPRMLKELREGIGTLGVRAMDLSSGASHDAAAFATAGVPTAMLFIRNSNGSHNPHEAMTIRDFMEATRVLAWWLANRL
jgi:beta-ureidopropionase / N-carbamoyl-L-amino-acid hydrolase